MKIINAIHAQSIGGVDQVFRDYTETLVKQGHEVALLISDSKQCEYKILGITKIFKLRNSAQILDVFHLLKILIQFKPDLIICHSNRLMSWAKFLRFFRKIGLIKTKVAAVNHGITFKRSLLCDYAISINQEISNMVIDSGFETKKSFVLKNAIRIDQPYHEKILKNPPVIGIYGRIEMRKGFDILMKACGILKERGIDFRLKVGGFEIDQHKRGWHNLSDWARAAKIYDKCSFVGVVTDKKKFFEDVDIFCVPSREEPFGIVILESFLHSTLVISSDTVGGKLLINDGENGTLFESENVNDLADKIMQTISNANDYNHKTRNAFLRLEKEFSFDSLAKGMSEILQKISQDA